MNILDTSILIEISNATPAGKKIADEIRENEWATTAVSVYEFLKSGSEEKNKLFLEKFVALKFTKQAAYEGAKIHRELKKSGKMINSADIYIAGIVKANQGRLYTLDSDFAKISGLDARIY
ncbi:type II toxin-antitoxin system VapC family toxin [Candidatus Micrarchaeota archaeon]|nr:type II toxin-antitoxin system VapC family toxin [Candidatus Micrarchaeota archaeon]